MAKLIHRKVGGCNSSFLTGLAAVLLATQCTQAQDSPAIQWQYNYGGSSPELANSISATPDGGYILAGRAISDDGDVTGHHGFGDIWVVKLDQDGAIAWERCYGGTETEELVCRVLPTRDGGYIVGGTTPSSDGDVECTTPPLSKAWVLKLNDAGVVEWQRCYGGSGLDRLLDLQETEDGYVFCGSSISTDGDVGGNQGLADLWVVRLDETGEILWTRSYGGSWADVGRSISATADGGFIIAGQTSSNSSILIGVNPYYVAPGLVITGWLTKLDGSGDIQWQRCYGGYGDDYFYRVAQAPDGTYWAVGSTSSTSGDVVGNNGGVDAWVVRIGPTGELLGQRAFGGSNSEQFYGLHVLPNGSALLAGYTASSDGDIEQNQGAVDALVVLLSEDLNMLWQTTLGGSLLDHGYDIVEGSDGGAVMAGSSQSSDGDLTGNNGSTDLWVVKLEAWDETGINAINTSTLTLFPNPTTNTLQVQWSGPAPQAFEVLDITGRLVYGPVVTTRSGKEGYELSVAGWAPGLYTLRMHSTAGPVMQRFVKE